MKGIVLISGGFDSGISAYLMKSKLDLVALHFSYEPFTDNQTEKKARKVCKVLGIKKFIVINIGKEVADISKKCNHKYYFVLSKRLMLKKGEGLAKKEKADFLITGDSLGQVSSQTLENLYCIDQAVDIPVLRPLIGFDKNEIIDLCKKIKIHDIAIGPEVCDVLGPKHPITRGRIENVEREERFL